MVELLELPALKVLLHAAKHSHADVCGLLLGPVENTSIIDDAVPLFHHTTVGPLLETAFLLVEQYALTRVLAAAFQLQGNYPSAVVLRLRNDKLASRTVVPFEIVSINEGAAGAASGNAGAAAAGSLKVGAGGMQAFDRVTQKGIFAACRSLVDMDEHLDDAKRDFRNLHVAQLLL
ncbi:mov34 mpn pad-1 family protein [Nannochloropsis oceanica]